MSKIQKIWRGFRGTQRNTARQHNKKPFPQPPSSLLLGQTNTEYLRFILSISQEHDLKAFAIPLSWDQPVRLGVPSENTQNLLTLVSQRDTNLSVTYRGKKQGWRKATTLPLKDFLIFLNSEESEVFVQEKGELTVFYLHPHGVFPHSQADILGTTSIVEVETWKPTSRGTHKGRLTNLHTNEIDLSHTQESFIMIRGEAGFPSFKDFASQTLDQISYPIDAVYLWVNDSDPAWKKKKTRALEEEKNTNLAPETVSNSRFRDHNELLYSLRSLSENAPWLNHIWIVTDEQIPNWLNTDNPKITIVDHKQILPAQALPNFNSHALSANLHKIPGLSEHFIYMNDDVFLGAPTDPSFWFAPNRTTRVHYTNSRRPGISVQETTVPVQARLNAINLAQKYVNNDGVQTRNLQHGPHPLTRSIMEEVWEIWEKELSATTINKFRNPQDVEPIWLYNIYATAMRYANEGEKLFYSYILMDEKISEDKLQELLQLRNRQVFCLNDGHGEEALEENKLSDEDRLKNYFQFLNSYFPKKSIFEK